MTDSNTETLTEKLRNLVCGGLVCGGLLAGAMAPAVAAPPSANDDIDYAASGFMLPPGVQPAAFVGGMPAMQMPGQMPGAQSIATTLPSAPLMMSGQTPGQMMMPGGVMPVGFHGGGFLGGGGYAPQSCDSMGCSCGATGCDSSGGCGGTFQGILPSLMGDCCNSCGGGGCGLCGGLGSCLTNGALGRGGLLGDLNNCGPGVTDMGILAGTIGGAMQQLSECLRPYAEGGKCSQRWYDFSLEGMFLSQSISQPNAVLTNRGIAPFAGPGPVLASTVIAPNNPALSMNDTDTGLEAGFRASAAMIFGAGGNLEVTYMGGHEWSDQVTARETTPDAQDLYSFISKYGNFPGGVPAGLDDTDRSISQTLTTTSAFHSGEFNYRRRTVGPYCRFQGSWLVGLRYLRYDNGMGFDTLGTLDDGAGNLLGGSFGGVGNDELRFFNSASHTQNNYFGPQAGFDFWYNMIPGVQLGVGMKGAWMQNDWDRSTLITANSIGPGAAAGTNLVQDGGQETTLMGEFEAKLVYRISQSWAIRSSYHLIAIDDVVLPGYSEAYARSVATELGVGNTFAGSPAVGYGSGTIQGFTLGAEYMW